jgi:chlorite dismutase
MNKRRGETLNWYSEGFERRALMMREHGHIGRHYAGKVTQIISGRSATTTGSGASICTRRIRDVQEVDLRDALRRGERQVRRVRPVLHGVHFSASQLGAFLNGRRSLPLVVGAGFSRPFSLRAA